jgi:hypothetical protein
MKPDPKLPPELAAFEQLLRTVKPADATNLVAPQTGDEPSAVSVIDKPRPLSTSPRSWTSLAASWACGVAVGACVMGMLRPIDQADPAETSVSVTPDTVAITTDADQRRSPATDSQDEFVDLGGHPVRWASHRDRIRFSQHPTLGVRTPIDPQIDPGISLAIDPSSIAERIRNTGTTHRRLFPPTPTLTSRTSISPDWTGTEPQASLNEG